MGRRREAWKGNASGRVGVKNVRSRICLDDLAVNLSSVATRQNKKTVKAMDAIHCGVNSKEAAEKDTGFCLVAIKQAEAESTHTIH